MPVIVGEVVRLNVRGTMQGSSVQFGHHFRAKTSGATLSGLAASYASGVVPLITSAVSAEVTLVELAVSSTRADGDEQLRAPLPGGTVGTQTGDALPGQNSMLVSVHTGVRGKRRRGRFYVPGVSETSQIGGRIIAPQLTALTALAEGLQTQFTGAGNANWELCVYSPPSPPPPPVKTPAIRTDTITTPATDLIADSIVVTQRRRRLGVGA